MYNLSTSTHILALYSCLSVRLEMCCWFQAAAVLITSAILIKKHIYLPVHQSSGHIVSYDQKTGSICEGLKLPKSIINKNNK